MILIKTAGKNDLLIIKKLAEKIWPTTFSSILSQQQIRYMLNWMYSLESLSKQMNEGCIFFLAFENVNPIGFASCQKISNTESKLHKLYVLPEMQGKKVGYTLLQEVIKHTNQQGLKKLVLNVNRHNRQAIDFYIRTGFTVEKEEDIDIGEGYYMNDYVMQIELS